MRASPDRAYLLALLAATFVFLAVIGYPRQWSQGLLINDEFWYAHLARNLYEGNGYVSNVMYPVQASRFEGFPVPEAMKQGGFQLVTAFVWLFTGESVRAMLTVAALGLVAFVGGVYLLARHLGWGPGVSAFVGAASIVHPVMAQYGVQALPESLYFVCFIFTVLFVLRGRTPDLVAAGVLNAALMIIKGHGLIYIPVFCAYLWLRDAGGLAEALRPSAQKLRAVGTYVGVGFVTLVVAWATLPEGSVRIFQQGGTYSHGYLIEVGRITSAIPYLSVDPPPAWEYIVAHPDQFLGKVARMVKRTKMMIETLAGPAMGGILFPALLLSSVLTAGAVAFPGRLLPRAERKGEEEPYLLFAACLAWALLFLWPIFLTPRLLMHMLPLMVLICLYAGFRLGAVVGPVRPELRKLMVVAAAAWFVAYPAVATIWDSYREPRKLLGSLLAVRHLDYEQMARNVENSLPADAVIVSDMAHEIAWLTGRRAIAFPNREEDLEYVIDKFDVDAVYEHPRLQRGWAEIRRRFTLVDGDNGFLWLRRRAGD